jgi:hypothetical protein
LALQVQNTLNLLQASRINPNILAHEALNGPYNWDRYPLVPPGCKAIIYEALAMQGSWALQVTDTWYLGPSKDHNQCNSYYVPKISAHQILGSAELFPQYCQVLNPSNMAHLKALTKELKMSTSLAVKTHKGRTFIHKLSLAIDGILNDDPREEQKMSTPNATSVEYQSNNYRGATHYEDAGPNSKKEFIQLKCTH